MAKKFSVTVHPAPLSGEYLTVSDAMHQILDLIEALERAEATKAGDRRIVWRLTEAHTNSPPFTVVAEPYPVNPELSVGFEANRIMGLMASDLGSLLEKRVVAGLMRDDITSPIVRVLERNQGGIGRTDISIGDDVSIAVLPATAKSALLAIEKYNLSAAENVPDWTRTEYGSIEGEIRELSTWNNRPALKVMDRLSEKVFPCVLSDELSNSIGAQHDWNEVWEGRRVAVTGALHFNESGDLKRADAESLEWIGWTDVPLSDLREIDILGERTMAEHLALIRMEGNG